MAMHSGTTEECFADFRVRFPGDDSRKLLARFAQVAEHTTARRWIAGQVLPVGETLIRARCFLFLAGYHVTEFRSLPPMTQKLALLIATDIVSVDEAHAVMAYNDKSAILNILLRGTSPVRDKVFRMERLVNAHQAELDEAVGSWVREIARELKLDSGVGSDTPVPLPAQPEKPSASPTKRKRVRDRPKKTDKDTPLGDLPVERSGGPENLSVPSPSELATARALAHLLQAMDEVIRGMDSGQRRELEALLAARVSGGRRKVIRDFLDKTLDLRP